MGALLLLFLLVCRFYKKKSGEKSQSVTANITPTTVVCTDITTQSVNLGSLSLSLENSEEGAVLVELQSNLDSNYRQST